MCFQHQVCFAPASESYPESCLFFCGLEFRIPIIACKVRQDLVPTQKHAGSTKTRIRRKTGPGRFVQCRYYWTLTALKPQSISRTSFRALSRSSTQDETAKIVQASSRRRWRSGTSSGSTRGARSRCGTTMSSRTLFAFA